MNYIIKNATASDETLILNLYKTVARISGGIARIESEITESYIKNNLEKSLKSGVCLVISHPENTQELIAEIHCSKLEPQIFKHTFSDLTIAVHPDFQGKGVGKAIFMYLLNYIENTRHDILRVELIARESNQKAIEFYQKIGFKIEGRFENRISNPDGTFEADIPMAWMNQNFKTQ
ncbi:MAG: GNAT family N-acetyltransferase [Raineya sp.]|jgi:ribosomal protein S18 acetylase RimI-like enzyme|nr:GNAT family N-acetyltransferase [Raineya sp.]